LTTASELVVAIAALGMAVLLGLSNSPTTLAADAGNYSKLPQAVQMLKPGVELVGYKHCFRLLLLPIPRVRQLLFLRLL
jgi:hypothetical protein